MKGKVSLKDRFKYFFDNTLSRGTVSIIIWLSVITFFSVLFFAVIYIIIGVPFEDTGKLTFFEAFWQSLMRSLDPGTVAGDTKWGLRIVGFLVTISGIFILSSLIGILTAGLEAKLEDLRKGRSIVLEEGHTLIIGWSQKIFHIISQLIIANENQTKPRIVILADRDKAEMDDEIRDKIKDFKNTRVITRSGDPLDLSDLEIVRPDDAKSIIILAPDKISNPDLYVIKSILALTYNPNRKNKKYHIVAEIREQENLDAAQTVGKDEVSFIFTQDIVAKITAQTAHQNGLSTIYYQLFSYEGDELYFEKIPWAEGKTYKDLLFAYEDSAVVGFMNDKGEIFINPPMDSPIKQGYKVLAISEDDDTVIPSGKTAFNIKHELIINKPHTSSVETEKTLILGWNQRAEKIIEELDNYVKEGSSLVVVFPHDISNEIEQIRQKIKNQTIRFIRKEYYKRITLVEIGIEEFSTAIILGNTDLPHQEADAFTILTLIHIRNITETAGKKVKIISEMFDQKNRELAEVTRADDFIISHDLISRILAQISETKELKTVFEQLFTSEGSEIYLKDIENYVKPGEKVNFYTLLEAAALRGETAIGYRIMKYEFDHSKDYGIVINPKKSEEIIFEKGDKIIVLAED